jgi:hypothetical protein
MSFPNNPVNGATTIMLVVVEDLDHQVLHQWADLAGLGLL